MGIRKVLSADEARVAFVVGNRVGTSFARRPEDTRCIECRSCGRGFFVGPGVLIGFDLCDECFEPWNCRNLASRFSGGPRVVPVEPDMHLWPEFNPFVGRVSS